MVDQATRQEILGELLSFQLSGDNPELQARINEQLASFADQRDFSFPDQTQFNLQNIATELEEAGLYEDAYALSLFSDNLVQFSRLNYGLTYGSWEDVVSTLSDIRANLTIHNVAEDGTITADYDTSDLSEDDRAEIRADEASIALIEAIETTYSEQLNPFVNIVRDADFYGAETANPEAAAPVEWALSEYSYIALEPTSSETLMAFGREQYDVPERTLDGYSFLLEEPSANEDFLAFSEAAYNAEHGEGAWAEHVASRYASLRADANQGGHDGRNAQLRLDAYDPNAALAAWGTRNAMARSPEFLEAVIADYEALNGEGAWDAYVEQERDELRAEAEGFHFLGIGRDESEAAYENFTAEALAVEWALNGGIRTQAEIAQTAIDNLHLNTEFLATAEENYNALHGEGAWAEHVAEEIEPRYAELRTSIERQIADLERNGTNGPGPTAEARIAQLEAALERIDVETATNMELANWATTNIYSQANQMNWEGVETFGLDPNIFANLDATTLVPDESMYAWNSENANEAQFAQAWLDASETLYNARHGEGAWAQEVARNGWNEETAMQELAAEGESAVHWFESNVTSAGFTYAFAGQEEVVSLLYLIELNGSTQYNAGDFGSQLWRGVFDPTLLAATTGAGYMTARFAARRALMEAAENYMTRTVTTGLARPALAGATGGAIEGAATEFALGYFQQDLQIQEGMIEELNFSALGQRAAFGALFGAGLGGVMGAGGGVIANWVSRGNLSQNLISAQPADASPAYTDFVRLVQNAEEAAADLSSPAQREAFEQAMRDVINFDADNVPVAEANIMIEQHAAIIEQLRNVADQEGIDITVRTDADASIETSAPEIDTDGPAEIVVPDVPNALDGVTLRGEDAASTPAANSPSPLSSITDADTTPVVDTSAPARPVELDANPIPAQPGSNLFTDRLAASLGPLDGYSPRGPVRAPAGEGTPGGTPDVAAAIRTEADRLTITQRGLQFDPTVDAVTLPENTSIPRGLITETTPDGTIVARLGEPPVLDITGLPNREAVEAAQQAHLDALRQYNDNIDFLNNARTESLRAEGLNADGTPIAPVEPATPSYRMPSGYTTKTAEELARIISRETDAGRVAFIFDRLQTRRPEIVEDTFANIQRSQQLAYLRGLEPTARQDFLLNLEDAALVSDLRDRLSLTREFEDTLNPGAGTRTAPETEARPVEPTPSPHTESEPTPTPRAETEGEGTAARPEGEEGTRPETETRAGSADTETPDPNLGRREIRVGDEQIALADLTVADVKNINVNDLRTITMAEMETLNPSLMPVFRDQNLIRHFGPEQMRFIRDAISDVNPDRGLLGRQIDNVRRFFTDVSDLRAARRTNDELTTNTSRVRELEGRVTDGTATDGTLDPDALAAQAELDRFLNEGRIGNGPEPHLINLRSFDDAYERALKNNAPKDELAALKAELDTASELAAREVNEAIANRRKAYNDLPSNRARADYLREMITDHIDSFPSDQRHQAWRDLLTRNNTILEVVSGLAYGRQGVSVKEARNLLGEVYSPIRDSIPFIDGPEGTPEITHMGRLQFVSRKMDEIFNLHGTGSMNWRSSHKVVGAIVDSIDTRARLIRNGMDEDAATKKVNDEVIKQVRVFINNGASPSEVFWLAARSARIKGLREVLLEAISDKPRGIGVETANAPILHEIVYQAVRNDPVEGFPADPHRISWSRELLAKMLTPGRPEFAHGALRTLGHVTGYDSPAMGGVGWRFLPENETALGFFNPWNWRNTTPVRAAINLSYNNPIMGGHWIHTYPRGFESPISRNISRVFGLTLFGLTAGATVDHAIDGEYDNPLFWPGVIQSEVLQAVWEVPVWLGDVAATNIAIQGWEGVQEVSGRSDWIPDIGDAEYDFYIDPNGVDIITPSLLLDGEFREEALQEQFPSVFNQGDTDPADDAPVLPPRGGLTTGAVTPADTDTDTDTTVVADAGTTDDTVVTPTDSDGTGDDTPTGGDDTPDVQGTDPNARNRLAAARQRPDGYSAEEVIQAVIPGAPGEFLTSVGSQAELGRIWQTARGWLGDAGRIMGSLWNAMGQMEGPWGGIAQIGTAIVGAMFGRNLLTGLWDTFTTGANWRSFAITGGLAIGAMHAFNYFSGSAQDNEFTVATDYRPANSGLGRETLQRYEGHVHNSTTGDVYGQLGSAETPFLASDRTFADAQDLIRGQMETTAALDFADAANATGEIDLATLAPENVGDIAVVGDMRVSGHDGIPYVLASVVTPDVANDGYTQSWTALGEMATEGAEQAAEQNWGFVAAQNGAHIPNVAPIVAGTFAISALDEDEQTRAPSHLPAALRGGDNAIIFDQSPHLQTAALESDVWGTGTASSGSMTPGIDADDNAGPINFNDLTAEPEQPVGLA